MCLHGVSNFFITFLCIIFIWLPYKLNIVIFFLFLGRYLHIVIKRDRKNNDVVLYGFIDHGATFTLNKEFESYVVNRLKEGNYKRIIRSKCL